MVVLIVGLTVLVFAFMLVEASRAAHNERLQRARGGIEPDRDVYAAMQVAYPGIFIAMIAEAAWRGVQPGPLSAVGLAVFAAAKVLKWWAIHELGQAWTFRVIVVPGSKAVVSGPYGYLRHPNYVAVVGEIVGVALMTSAVVAGPVSMALFGVLLARRIAVENRALNAILRRD